MPVGVQVPLPAPATGRYQLNGHAHGNEGSTTLPEGAHVTVALSCHGSRYMFTKLESKCDPNTLLARNRTHIRRTVWTRSPMLPVEEVCHGPSNTRSAG